MVKMELSKTTSKTSSLKALILKAWRERWTDIQWGINIKTIIPRGVSGDLYNLADCILQQAMVGCGVNQLVISYLKHSLASHLVSYMAVIQRISKFDAFNKPHCILSLLDFLESFPSNITCRSKMEEEVLASSVMSMIFWLLEVYHNALSKYPATNTVQSQELLEKSTLLLNSIVQTDFLIASFYLAKQNDPDEYDDLTKKCHEITNLMIMNTQIKAPLAIHDTLQKLCNMDIHKIAPLSNKTGPLTHCMQSIFAVNNLVNPSADMTQIASQLLLIQRIKGFSLARVYCEFIRAALISLNDCSDEAVKQSLWAAFTFIKVPLAIHCLHSRVGTVNKDGDYSTELGEGIELLLQSSPLLDTLDFKCSCNCIVSLLETFKKMGIISDSQFTYFSQKRGNKEIQLPKKDHTGIQGSVPAFITARCEPTIAGILKTMGGELYKTQDSLYALLCQIGATLEKLLGVAVIEGKLKVFVSRLIKFNEFALQSANDKGSNQSKVYMFDISFLILCAIAQLYGLDMVLDENGDSFFEKWVRDCMVLKRSHKSPDQILEKCDPQVVDVFIHHLSAPDFDFKNTNLKPHDLCMNVSSVIKEVLYAWEQGSLSTTDVNGILESLRQKMPSLAVCATAWLCAYINSAHKDAIQKPITMIQQFLLPITDVEAQINKFTERANLMAIIIRKMLGEVHTPFYPKQNRLYAHIPSTQPMLELFKKIWVDVKKRGYLHIDATRGMQNLLNVGGAVWFVSNLIKETLKYRQEDDLDRAVDIVLGIFHLNLEKCTEALLMHVIPQYLYNSKFTEELVEPQCGMLARLTVYCILATMEPCNSGLGYGVRKRRHDDHEDHQDASSKMRRLNDNTVESALFPAFNHPQPPGIALKEPLLTSLETLYTSFSQLAAYNGDVTPHTYYIFHFLQYVVQCSSERSQALLHILPNDLIPTLIRALPNSFNIGLILRLHDLSTPQGRKDAARDLCLLRNLQLRPE